MNDKPRRTVEFTPEQRAQHKLIRDTFRDWHPGPEEIIATGAAARLGLNVLYAPATALLGELKQTREASGLTLAEVSRLCGIDQPALSRLENGHNRNPTLDTLWKYAAALGKRLVLDVEEVEMTKPTRKNSAARGRAPRKGARKKTAGPSSRKHPSARK